MDSEIAYAVQWASLPIPSPLACGNWELLRLSLPIRGHVGHSLTLTWTDLAPNCHSFPLWSPRGLGQESMLALSSTVGKGFSREGSPVLGVRADSIHLPTQTS